MEDVASGAHAAIVKRDWGALQPLLHPYLHWVQADGQDVRGRTKVIAMRQAIGISGPPGVRRVARRPGLPLVRLRVLRFPLVDPI
jgi:hypothetical protein